VKIRNALWFAAWCLAAISFVAPQEATAAKKIEDKAKHVTGQHWTASTEAEKRAFLYGMATVIWLEDEIQGDNGCDKSLVDTWVEGLDDETFDTVLKKLSEYYAANPGKLDRPVVEVLWYEVTEPNVKAERGGKK